MPEKTQLAVYGLIDSLDFIRGKYIMQDLHESEGEVIAEPTIVPLFEFDWKEYLIEKRKELRGEVWTYTDPVMIFVNNNLIGGVSELLSWATENFPMFCDFRPDILYQELKKEFYIKSITDTKHLFVYMDMTCEGEQLGRFVIELYNDLVPKAAENFRALCTGEYGTSKTTGFALHYKNTLIHRIVPNGWIQAGDIHEGKGNGGESIFGQYFNDECFAIKHDRAGIVGFANKGPHTNQSQFYITLQSSPWMDAKYESIGRIVEGFETLEAIKNVETLNERPTKLVTVENCGQLLFEY